MAVTEETQLWWDETAAEDYLPRLRAALKESKTTQLAFARQCGCSPSFMGIVLRGGYPQRDGKAVPKFIWQAARIWLRLRPTASEEGSAG